MPQESPSLISPEYLEQQKRMFEDHPTYGTHAKKYAEVVASLATAIGPECTILDYGCGREFLQELLPQFIVDGYDPAIEDLSERPEPHDLVVCLDVLEHIEPHKLEAVLNDLERCTQKVLYVNICVVPSFKFLPDGRNAHLIVKPLEWWLPKLWRRWAIDAVVRNERGVDIQITCSLKEEQAAREKVILEKVEEGKGKYQKKLETGELKEIAGVLEKHEWSKRR